MLLGTVAVALLAVGVVLLWRHPTHGGTIAWRGLEVSSAGAGLPVLAAGLVVLGGAVIVARDGPDPSPAPPSTATTGSSGGTFGLPPAGCFEGYFASLPAERTATAEVGATGLVVVGRDQPKEPPVGLRVTDRGDVVGGMRFRFVPTSDLFIIESVVDGSCAEIESFFNATRRGADKHTLKNFEHVFVDWRGATYDIGLGGTGVISVSVSRA